MNHLNLNNLIERPVELSSKRLSIFAPKQDKPINQAGSPNLVFQASKEQDLELLSELSLDSYLSNKDPDASDIQKDYEADKDNDVLPQTTYQGSITSKGDESIYIESSVTQQIPLSQTLRRKSCCCSDCGYLSTKEKKHQDITAFSKREEMNRKAQPQLIFLTSEVQFNDQSLSANTNPKEDEMKSVVLDTSYGAIKEYLVDLNPRFEESQQTPSVNEDEQVTESIKTHEINIPSSFKRGASSQAREITSTKRSLSIKCSKDSPIHKSSCSPLAKSVQIKNARRTMLLYSGSIKLESPRKSVLDQSSIPTFVNSSSEDVISSGSAKTFKTLEDSPVLSVKSMKKEELIKTIVPLCRKTMSSDFAVSKPYDLTSRTLTKFNTFITKGRKIELDKINTNSSKVKNELKSHAIQDVYCKMNGVGTPKLLISPRAEGCKEELLIAPRKIISKVKLVPITRSKSDQKSSEKKKNQKELKTGSSEFAENELETSNKPYIKAVEKVPLSAREANSKESPFKAGKEYKKLTIRVEINERIDKDTKGTKNTRQEGDKKRVELKIRKKSDHSLSIEKAFQVYQHNFQGKMKPSLEKIKNCM